MNACMRTCSSYCYNSVAVVVVEVVVVDSLSLISSYLLVSLVLLVWLVLLVGMVSTVQGLAFMPNAVVSGP